MGIGVKAFIGREWDRLGMCSMMIAAPVVGEPR
jgi:hypothetical protein